MGLDLLSPILRAPRRPPFGAILPGDAATGRIPPRDFRAMVKADNDWVYRCARVNAENISKVPLRLYRRSTGEEVVEHPFLDLLRNVNPEQGRFDLFEMTELFLELVGNSYWYVAPMLLENPVTKRRVPGEIWTLQAQYVKIVPGRSRMVDGYLYQSPGTPTVAFEPEEILHFKFPSAESLYYGKGPVEGGRAAVNTHESMAAYEAALFRNMARPDGALITDKDLAPEQIKALRAEWARIHQGADRSGNVAILQRGLKYEAMGTTPKELDYLAGKAYNREQIAAMFGVPLSKLGIEIAADRAAAEAHDLTYQKETIAPRLERIASKLNERMLPIYDADLEARFDDPVPENNEMALKKRDSDLDRGVITINEVRREEGLEDVEWGDEPFVKSPVINFGTGVDGGAQDDEDEKAIITICGVDSKSAQAFLHRNAGTLEEIIRRTRKAGRWERFIAATWPLEKSTRRQMRQFFVEQRRIVEGNLDKMRSLPSRKAVDPLVASILFSLGAEKVRLAGVAKPLLEQALAIGAAFGGEGLSDIDFDVLNPLVLEALRERVEFLSTRVNEETARALTEQIAAGIEAGETTQQIADRIADVYEQATGYRAIRIARTEILSASNKGATAAYKAGGATGKRWVTAGDELVRESHRAANGQVVGIAQKFTVGDSQLDHPGDPAGAPGEIINCRCTTVAVVERG